MNDDEIDAAAGAALPEDHDDDSWIDWQEMGFYRDGDVVLTMQSPSLQLFGFRREGTWHEMMDGEEFAKPGYQPVQWTAVPREKWADFAFG